MTYNPNQHVGHSYLRTKVMTARPEQLRLMLYDGAIKFCRQARHALAQQDYEGMYNGLVRTQNIVLELSSSLNPQAEPELCDRLAALYNYIYRRLVDANLERDLAAIDEALKLIEYERETWQLMINKLTEAREQGDDPVEQARETLGPIARIGATPDPPAAPTGTADDQSGTTGFSVQG